MDILKYAVKRILIALLTLFIVTAITFFLMNLIPGDPFMSEKATEASRAALRAGIRRWPAIATNTACTSSGKA